MSSSDEFDTIIANSQVNLEPSVAKRVWTAGVGMFTAALPAYLFATVLDLSVQDYLPIYLSVTILSGIALSFAYQAFFVGSYIKFQRDSAAKQYKGKASDKKQWEEARETLLVRQANSYAIFYINTVFLSLAIILGFYVLKATSLPINYAASVSVSAGLLTWLASQSDAKN
eukprot:TRINITY_DN939_c0_g1_i1.p1 TRINITY_DN939_c0_g1~~TRINITY_DN939_c0_g1_i1.p1  ORF type:complete len:200 (-),score=84.65 TRINITY_DN939_c0_g1_i1:111-623(-)